MALNHVLYRSHMFVSQMLVICDFAIRATLHISGTGSMIYWLLTSVAVPEYMAFNVL